MKHDQLTIDLAMIARNAIDELIKRKKDPDRIHTCSYYCTNFACIKAQRDELRDRLENMKGNPNEDVQGYGI